MATNSKKAARKTKDKKAANKSASAAASHELQDLLSKKLEEWKIPSDEQSLHFRTDRFGDSFPNVAAKTSKEILEKNLWWWRLIKQEDCAEIFSNIHGELFPSILLNVFKDHYETSAFFYEMRARYENRYRWDFDRPWVRCSLQQWRFMDCLVSNPYPAKQFLPSDVKNSNWVSLDAKFNLKLSDETLCDLFRAELLKRRERLGIPRPASGKGTRRKQISWQPIEFLDIARYGVDKLNESERSQLSKAKAAYVDTCKSLCITP